MLLTPLARFCDTEVMTINIFLRFLFSSLVTPSDRLSDATNEEKKNFFFFDITHYSMVSSGTATDQADFVRVHTHARLMLVPWPGSAIVR